MKKINLIEMLQGCSKRNGTAVYASNPDGQPTVNRRSKLTSYRGWCKKLTMIFAVLVLSIGQMWGATETLTWALTSNTNCSGGTNVSGGSVTPVNGSTYKAGTWSFSGSKYISEAKKHSSDSYWEDLSSCSASGCADPTTTARLEFPITINTGYSFNLTGISLTGFEQQSGSGPVIQVYVVQGSTKTWVGGNYTKDTKPNLNNLNISLSAGTAKVVFILGVASNLTNGRGFRFTGFTVTGTSTASGGGGDPTPSTYTVTYDGNGKTSGSVPTDANSPYANGATVTVLGNTGSLAKTGYTFTGWNTAADGSGTDYAAGETFSMGTANVTLYAQWELNLTTHTPGTYEAAVGSGGYGQTLVTSNSRQYEVYQYNKSSSTAIVYAGTNTTSTSASNVVMTYDMSTGVVSTTKGWITQSGAIVNTSSNTTKSDEFQATALHLNVNESYEQTI